MLRHFLNAIALAAALSAAGCGIKGPLVLPPAEARTSVPPTTIPPNSPSGPTARPAERVQ